MRKLSIILILIYYIWTLNPNGTLFDLHSYQYSYYNLLTDSLLKKHLYIDIKPPIELLNSPDPYDPYTRKNPNPYIGDLSLYKEKLFLYSGVAPAIVLFLPYRFITGLRLSEPLACLIFMFGSFLFSVSILHKIKMKYFKTIPDWMLFLSYLSLGICNVAPYLFRRALFYEVAISGGCFFLVGGVYFALQALENSSRKNLILTSLFLGLTVGSRPNLIFASILIPIVLYLIKKENKLTKEKLQSILAPYAFILLLLGIYNYLRFDSFIDFGHRYQIGYVNLMKERIFSPEMFLSNCYIYFLKPVVISSKFPFFEISFWAAPIHEKLWKWEKMIGILYYFPPSFMPIYLLVNYKKIKSFQNNSFPQNEILIISTPVITSLTTLLFLVFQTFRYYADFMTLLVLISMISWFYLFQAIDFFNMSKSDFMFLSTTLIAVGIIFSLAFSIVGCFDGLKAQNPSQFEELKSFFTPISKLLLLLGYK